MQPQQLHEIMAKTETIGTISSAAFAGLLEGLHEEGASVGGPNQTKLKELSDQLIVVEMKLMSDIPPMVKVNDTHDRGACKLLLSLKFLGAVDLAVGRPLRADQNRRRLAPP